MSSCVQNSTINGNSMRMTKKASESQSIKSYNIMDNTSNIHTKNFTNQDITNPTISKKPQINMIQFKKKFTSLAQRLQQQYKLNTSIYKQKYYQISDAVNQLYQDIQIYNGDLHMLEKCVRNHQEETGQGRNIGRSNGDQVMEGNSRKVGKRSSGDSIDNNNSDTFNQQQYQIKLNKSNTNKNNEDNLLSKRAQLDFQLDPLLIVDYFRDFIHNMVKLCLQFKQKQKNIRQQISKLFSSQNNTHYLQVLAQKNLQNYDLSQRNNELQKILSQKVLQARMAQRTTQDYQKKFKQQQKDFNEIIITISNILKKCETSQIELRQQNRLQKQLIQTHKIQFQRYKSDFKMKPSYEEKANRIRQVLEKKFQDREILLVKQTENIVAKRYKGNVHHQNKQNRFKQHDKDKNA